MNRSIPSQFSWKTSATFALSCVVLASSISTSAVRADTPTVDLPKLHVSADRVLPDPESWRYARTPEFEILSNASERETRRLVQSLQRFDRVVEIVWPALHLEGHAPIRLVICGRGEKFDQFMPTLAERQNRSTASLVFQNREISTMVIDAQARSLNTANTLFLQIPGGQTEESRFDLDHEKLLQREYLHLLLGRLAPRPHAWLEEGLAQIFGEIKYDERWLRFGELEDPQLVDAGHYRSDPQFNKLLGAYAIPMLSFDDFFGVQHSDPAARSSVGNLWAKQSAAFVHLCLFGEKKKYQKAFLTFIARSDEQPATPELFESCFGMSYKKMLGEIRTYAKFASYRYEEFKAKKDSVLVADPAPIALREATQGEIGRIKGEVFQLIGHQREAREEITQAYQRGERDADLLSSLGLLEVDSGEDARARKFLEAAFKEKTRRQLALFELSRLRFAEALKSPAGSQKRLDRKQAAYVLEPLYAALAVWNRNPETYERIAGVFERTETTFKPQELAILGEGVRNTPTHTVFVYRTARLLTRNGYAADAQTYIEHGKKLSRSDAVRSFFERLEQENKTKNRSSGERQLHPLDTTPVARVQEPFNTM